MPQASSVRASLSQEVTPKASLGRLHLKGPLSPFLAPGFLMGNVKVAALGEGRGCRHPPAFENQRQRGLGGQTAGQSRVGVLTGEGEGNEGWIGGAGGDRRRAPRQGPQDIWDSTEML